MLRFLLSIVLALAASGAQAADVRLAVIKTATLKVTENKLFVGGDSSRELRNNFSAFLIQHGDMPMLFDTGLGSHVKAQYDQDMRWWQRPFFRYDDPVLPAQAQLAAAGIGPVTQIVLSHTHWDHASGLDDFPGAQVWVPKEEMPMVDAARQGQRGAGSAWPSQVGSPAIDWHLLGFDQPAYEGFEASHDQFGDGSVVFVPMFGHTPGSTGLFLRLGSGKRIFLVGDVVWSAGALKDGAPKIWAARQVATTTSTRRRRPSARSERCKSACPIWWSCRPTTACRRTRSATSRAGCADHSGALPSGVMRDCGFAAATPHPC